VTIKTQSGVLFFEEVSLFGMDLMAVTTTLCHLGVRQATERIHCATSMAVIAPVLFRDGVILGGMIDQIRVSLFGVY